MTKTDTAIFAAGCFWGAEEAFRILPGVLSTRVGYTGGTTESPTWEQVYTGQTGHAEAVEVTYDPAQVSYEQLLETFFANHDPTEHNRQGPDVGSEYRTAIFAHNKAQRVAAEKAIEALTVERRFARPIATQVVDAAPFYLAEDYHQQYLLKRGLSSCHF